MSIQINHDTKIMLQDKETNDCIIIEEDTKGQPLITLFRWGHGTELQTALDSRIKFEMLRDVVKKMKVIDVSDV